MCACPPAEWSIHAKFLPKRPTFPRPQRAFPLSPLNRVMVALDFWLIIVAAVAVINAYASRPDLTVLPLFAADSPINALLIKIMIIPPGAIALYCVYCGVQRGWFRCVSRRCAGLIPALAAALDPRLGPAVCSLS